MFFKKETDEAKLRAYAYKSGAFETKKSAFDYFFIIEGKSLEEAEKMANTIASARGVPDVFQAKKGMFEQIKEYLGQAQSLATENPKIADFLIGLISGAATSLGGVAVGNKIAEQEVVRRDININVEPKEIENVEPISHKD